jgi:class 3 adenylate cyclase
MAEVRLQRRLAAIFSVDAVGYSHLMGIDEVGTLSRLNALRRDLINPTITAHSGRIVKLMGDGALVEFMSAVDAVTCAIEIQKRLRERTSDEADPIKFRIGINVGDIIIEGDDILGDGVNIAARIEAIAEPGGISISDDVWRQVQGKVVANFIDCGEQKLKNIGRPVRVYRVGTGTSAPVESVKPALATHAAKFSPDAALDTLTKLLALQYPWGEWSDRRTSIESIVAERAGQRGFEGPKPNVARTMFSLDALEPYHEVPVVHSIYQSALRWVRHGISNEWYQEWTPSQTIDSDDYVPSLIRRRDVRHTAQAAIILSKWMPFDENIAGLIRSIASSRLDSGLWPESPNLSSPRLLATVYAVEALGRVTAVRAGEYVRLLMGEANSSKVWASFRYGMAALHEEADSGGGLLGRSFGTPTAYLTGMALFRLASLVVHPDIRQLVNKFIAALEACKSGAGWRDASLPPQLDSETYIRTTLRVAAGLSLCEKHGVSVASETMVTLDRFVLDNCVGRPLLELDTSDLACLQIYLNNRFSNAFVKIDFDDLENHSRQIQKQALPEWKRNYELFIRHAEVGKTRDIRSYQPLLIELQDMYGSLIQLGSP